MALERLKLIIIYEENGSSETLEFETYGELRKYASRRRKDFAGAITRAITPDPEEEAEPPKKKPAKKAAAKKTKKLPKKLLQNKLGKQVQKKRGLFQKSK